MLRNEFENTDYMITKVMKLDIYFSIKDEEDEDEEEEKRRKLSYFLFFC